MWSKCIPKPCFMALFWFLIWGSLTLTVLEWRVFRIKYSVISWSGLYTVANPNHFACQKSQSPSLLGVHWKWGACVLPTNLNTPNLCPSSPDQLHWFIGEDLCLCAWTHTNCIQTMYFILSRAAEARSNELSKRAIQDSVITVANGKASIVFAPWQFVEMQCAFLN